MSKLHPPDKIYVRHVRYTNLILAPIFASAIVLSLSHHHTLVGGVLVGVAAVFLIYIAASFVFKSEFELLRDGLRISTRFYPTSEIEEILPLRRGKGFHIVTDKAAWIRVEFYGKSDRKLNAVRKWATDHNVSMDLG